MPDSRDRFQAASLMQALTDTQDNFARFRRAVATSAAAMAAVTETIVPDGFVTLGAIREGDPWIFRGGANYTLSTSASWTDTSPYATWRTSPPSESTVTIPAEPEDPTMWWGGCGLARCASCAAGGFYRDSRLTTRVPGTTERRGYCLTVRRSGSRMTRSVRRYWQANSERRARAYQGHFFPNEKVESVRRTRVRRNGSLIETYTPEQCNVMLPGVTCTIDDNRIY